MLSSSVGEDKGLMPNTNGTTTAHWERVRTIFLEALKQAPEDRDAFLDEACAGDPALRRDIASLIEADAEPGPMDRLADTLVGPLLSHFGASSELPLDVQVGPYEIVAEIGKGGMGVVYQAWDTRLDRYVALKFLPAHLQTHETARIRFVQEAKAASRLDHANICTIYEIGETLEGRFYIAMAYYDGETLDKHIKRGPLPVDEAVDLTLQIAHGLHEAHEAGIIHRDMKPSNVILTDRGEAKILDFGVAKLRHDATVTQPGTRIGTVSYMSPEQARGEPVDRRTDIWSLGVVFYEMLTGQRPFQGEQDTTVLHALLYETPAPLHTVRPDLPGPLTRIVDRMLTKDPDRRYSDVQTLITDLENRQAPEVVASDSVHGMIRGFMIAGLALLIAVATVLFFIFNQNIFSGSGDEFHTLAVLPLEDRSGDPDRAYFADGITDELIATLGQIESIRVISRTTAMLYKSNTQPVSEIAEELEVSTVIEGSVQPIGDRVRVVVRLVDAENNQVMLTRIYTRELRDMPNLQRDIALTIANEIQAELSPASKARLGDTGPVDPEAYRLYLLGQHFRNRENPESWDQATQYFRDAIARAPTFARAYAGLSRVLTQTLGERQAEEALKAADQALKLDPNLSDAYVSIGLVRELLYWEWAEAEEAFRQAVYLNPSDAEARHELGMLLMRVREFEEALRENQRAFELSPLLVRFNNGVAGVHLFSREYREAIDLLEQSRALEPSNSMTYWRLGQAHLELGNVEEAAALFEEMIERGGHQPYGHLGHAYAVAGRSDEARAVLNRLQELSTQEATYDMGWLAWNSALVYVGLGEFEQALDWLDRAYEARSIFFMYANVLPALDPLRDHPRFVALMKQVGF